MPIGDPAGIGPEIVLKALMEPGITDVVDPVVIGEAEALRRHAAAAGLAVDVTDDELRFQDGPRVPLRSVRGLGDDAWHFGETSPVAGRACRAYAIAGIDMVRTGQADAVVAAPHTEAAVNQAGFRFRGYPGLVAECTGVPEQLAFLMLLSPVYRVLNVTLHEPLVDAIARLDTALVLAAIRAAHQGLAVLGLDNPRIGVCGLNPHAGEGGLMGTEDDRIIAPAVAAAASEGMRAQGPLSADALFADRAHDVYLAMYHDQGHIPVKVASPRQATAITVGTPVPFGSVAHGSALDIAGQGRADPRALIQALRNLAGIAGQA